MAVVEIYFPANSSFCPPSAQLHPLTNRSPDCMKDITGLDSERYVVGLCTGIRCVTVAVTNISQAEAALRLCRRENSYLCEEKTPLQYYFNVKLCLCDEINKFRNNRLSFVEDYLILEESAAPEGSHCGGLA